MGVKRAVTLMLAEQRQRTRTRRTLGALFSAVAVVLAVYAVREPLRPELEGFEVVRPSLAEWGFQEGLDGSVLVTIGVPLPRKPLPNWKAPPCSSPKQRPINGACWKKLADPPGDDLCGEDYEYEGSCWAPVAKPQKAPLTLHEAQ